MWPNADVKLTGGPHGMPRGHVRSIQRDRLLRAVTAVVAREGYADTTVRKLLGEARLSRRTYYDLYVDKEDCYLDAYGEIADRLVERAEEGFERGSDPAERVRLAVRGLVDFCVEEQTAACACVVEGLAAGQAARVKRTELIERVGATIAPALGELQPGTPDAELFARATVGGIFELLYGPLARSDGEALRGLADRIGDLPILVPASDG